MTTLNAIISPAPALVTTVDSTGNLVLQTAGTNAVTYDANQNATHTGYISAPNTFGFKNRIINGDMRIDQRNAGASVTPATNNSYQSCDRWGAVLSQASKFSLQQNAGSVTPPVGFTNYLGITSLSAYTVGAGETFGIGQHIEGFNTADLGWGTANAKTVTLSFWVRSSLTGTFGGVFTNDANNRTYPFTYTIPSANTWTQISVTVAGDTTGTWRTDNGTGVWILFGLGTGSTYSGTAGSWAGTAYYGATGATSVVGTNGATFYLTGVQLETGSKATPFDMREYGSELRMCQRYYELHADTYQPMQIPMGYLTYCAGYWKFIVPKRAAPTVSDARSLTGTTLTNMVDQFGQGAFTPNGTQIDNAAINGCRIVLTFASAPGQSGTTHGDNLYLQKSGTFQASAEL